MKVKNKAIIVKARLKPCLILAKMISNGTKVSRFWKHCVNPAAVQSCIEKLYRIHWKTLVFLRPFNQISILYSTSLSNKSTLTQNFPVKFSRTTFSTFFDLCTRIWTEPRCFGCKSSECEPLVIVFKQIQVSLFLKIHAE